MLLSSILRLLCKVDVESLISHIWKVLVIFLHINIDATIWIKPFSVLWKLSQRPIIVRIASRSPISWTCQWWVSSSHRQPISLNNWSGSWWQSISIQVCDFNSVSLNCHRPWAWHLSSTASLVAHLIKTALIGYWKYLQLMLYLVKFCLSPLFLRRHILEIPTHI